MNNNERADMLRLMAEELNDSISAYEGAKKKPKDATQVYGSMTASNTAVQLSEKSFTCGRCCLTSVSGYEALR